MLAIRATVPSEHGDRPRLDVQLEVSAGITAVMGPSGAGKTTLLTAIAGLLRPSAGRITLGDTVLFDAAQRVFVPPHERRVALVFQSLALFPHLTAQENVAYGVPILRGKDRAKRALSWLSRARVEHVGDRFPSTLSGGEAQRVALARALASEPRALLLDEPFSAMDASLRAELHAELRLLLEELSLPTLLVTHDQNDANALASRIVQLEAGRLRE